jgi:Amt family ammonium transporter
MLLALPLSPAWAADGLNSGDTAWMIVATALVMMMTPAGLALFYGGMSRYKNLLNTLAMTFVAYCLTSLIWVLWGYSLAFGPDVGGIIGGLDFIFLSGITPASLEGTIPTNVFALFQMTFACITVALVLGSIVDRMKFSAWIVFTVLWVTFIYTPIAHWVWGKGWMATMGALDFAGGTVVHINAGVAGLVLCRVLGKRIGYGKEAMFPSSIALTALGAALLWFGWFGFNAGSALVADGLAGSAFLVTNTGGHRRLTDVHRWSEQALVSASPRASWRAGGYRWLPGRGMGASSSPRAQGLALFVARLKHKLGYDDSLDAFGVHGMCGTLGALATGLFADPAVNASGTGLFFGNAQQLLIQLISVLATAGFTAIGTLVLVYVTKALAGGLRVDEEKEVVGLDNAVHGERAFEID